MSLYTDISDTRNEVGQAPRDNNVAHTYVDQTQRYTAPREYAYAVKKPISRNIKVASSKPKLLDRIVRHSRTVSYSTKAEF